MMPSTQRFSDRASYYTRSRPSYPSGLMDLFRSDLGMASGDAVADIGSGTGLLTELFVQGGFETYAVEPNGPMRLCAERRLGNCANFHSVDGTAEASTLADGSVRFVTAAQAFHWFDIDRARLEFQRILKPGGSVVLIWNERRLDSTFLRAYDQLMQSYRSKESPRRQNLSQAGGDADIVRFFAPGKYQFASLENPQVLDRDGLIDRILSASYMPLPADPRYPQLLEEINRIFDEHQSNQRVQIMQDTQVYFGKLTA